MNIAIVGSRSDLHKDAKRWVKTVVGLFNNDDCLVSGRSPGGGPDVWAEEEADERGLNKKIFPIEGKGLSRIEFTKAAHARNTQIVQNSYVVIAFWNGFSGGTVDTIRKAKKLGKPVYIIQSEKEFQHLCQHWPDVYQAMATGA